MKDKVVVITDKYHVLIDVHGNHSPRYFVEGGHTIDKGKYAGQVAKSSWRETGKHFKNLAQAVHYGVEQGFIGDLSIKSEYTMDDYINYLWEVYNTTEELLNKAILA